MSSVSSFLASFLQLFFVFFFLSIYWFFLFFFFPQTSGRPGYNLCRQSDSSWKHYISQVRSVVYASLNMSTLIIFHQLYSCLSLYFSLFLSICFSLSFSLALPLFRYLSLSIYMYLALTLSLQHWLQLTSYYYPHFFYQKFGNYKSGELHERCVQNT